MPSQQYPVNGRIIHLRIEAKPKAINIIQDYFPTSDTDDDDIRHMYANVQDRIADCSKKEGLVVMGDFNAKIGEDTCRRACGKLGLDELNYRGSPLLDWLEDNKLIAVNTCFRHRFSQKFTWTSRGDSYHNQIDYITMRRSEIHDRCAVLIAVATTRWFGHALKEKAGLSRKRRMSERRDC